MPQWIKTIVDLVRACQRLRDPGGPIWIAGSQSAKRAGAAEKRFAQTVQGESAMEMTLRTVCRMCSALLDAEGYHTCYSLDSAGAELDFPVGGLHTAGDAELVHDAEQEALP